MSDTVAGLALVAEIAAMIALVAAYDPNNYIQSSRTAEDSWYTRLNTALDTSVGLDMIGNSNFTKAHALADISGISADLTSRFNLPHLYDTPCTANGYNLTAQGVLNNSLSGAVSGALEAVKLAAIEAYANITQANISAYINLLNLGKQTLSVVTVSSAPYAANLTGMANVTIGNASTYISDMQVGMSDKQVNNVIQSSGSNMNYFAGVQNTPSNNAAGQLNQFENSTGNIYFAGVNN